MKYIQKMTTFLMLMTLLIQTIATPLTVLSETIDSVTTAESTTKTLSLEQLSIADTQDKAVTLNLAMKVSNQTQEVATFVVQTTEEVRLVNELPGGVQANVIGKNITLTVGPSVETQLTLKMTTENTQQTFAISTEDGQRKEVALPAESVEESTTTTETTEETTETSTEEKREMTLKTVAAKDLGNIFSFKELKIDGKDVKNGDTVFIENGSQAVLNFDWNTHGLNAKEGDTASVQLPGIFAVMDIKNRDISVGGIVVGKYSITNGKLTFVFNKEIEKEEISNGFVNFKFDFDMSKFSENVIQEVPFNDREDTRIELIMKPTNKVEGLTKDGKPNSQMNAKDISWGIDFVNTSQQTMTKAQLTDLLPEGLGNPRDFVLKEITIRGDGRKVYGAAQALPSVPNMQGNQLTVPLGDVKPFKGYRIEYKTPIKDYTKQSFKNQAKVTHDAGSLEAHATVDKLTRSNPLQKSGKLVKGADGSDEIEWLITVNEGGSEIDDATINEQLPEGLIVVPETIEVTKNKQAHAIKKQAFPIHLGKVTANEMYQIKFRTKIDYKKINHGEYQKNNGFKNTAQLLDGETEAGKADSTVNVERAPILEKAGVSKVDYENKTIEWQVVVNRAKHPLDNVVVTDTLPKGLTLTNNNIKMTKADGSTFKPVSQTIGKPNAEGKTPVTMNLGNIGTETITITYTTIVEDLHTNHFVNGVSMTGDGIGTEKLDREVEIRPATNAFDKGFRGINYNKKTMDWEIRVDPRREGINHLEITDTFPNKGMILLPDTMQVTLNGKAFKEYTLAPIGNGYQNGFTLKVNDGVTIDQGQLSVKYQTSYDPETVVDGQSLIPHVGGRGKDRVYVNEARFTGETKSGFRIDTTRKAETTVRSDSWNSGKKDGRLVHKKPDGTQGNGWTSGTERKIAWDVYMNYQKQNLGKDVVVKDTLAYDGKIDLDSVKVYVYDVNADGSTKVGKLADIPFTATLDANNRLNVAFNDVVKERYMIQFTTDVPNISARQYKNNAAVYVNGKETTTFTASINHQQADNFLQKTPGVQGNRVFTGDEIDWTVRINDSLSVIKQATIKDTMSQGHVYMKDSLQVFRIVDGKEVPFTDYQNVGVEKQANGETVLRFDVANLQDTLVMKYKTIVTETNGKINNKVEIEGSELQTKSVESRKIEAKEFSSVGGEWASPTKGALSLKKIDAEEKKVIAKNETTFDVWFDLAGEKVYYGEYQTKNGVLNLGNLRLTKYYLKEKVAPKGYVLSNQEIEVNVTKPYGTNKHVENVTFENTKEKVTVPGTKVWEGGPQPSIQLQLFRNGQAFGEKVTLDGTEKTPWMHNWQDLDKTTIDGQEYLYTVDEVAVPVNYQKTVAKDGVTITNKFTMPTMDVPVTKQWDDAHNQDGQRYDVTLELLANGQSVQTKELKVADYAQAGDTWQTVFKDLPQFDAQNHFKEITYTVREVNVENGYTSTQDGIVITNQRDVEKVTLAGQKIWDDADNQDGKRPESITVRLLANGQLASVKDAVKEVTEKDAWQYQWENLPKYENGQEIHYTITEDEVAGYTTDKIESMNIVNRYAPEKTSLTVNKTWDDADNQDGKRPESVAVQLLADGKKVGQPVTLNADNHWQHVFADLAKNKTPGLPIAYTVEEVKANDNAMYQATYTYDETGKNVTIVNHYTPEKTTVSVKKVWQDARNQDGIRPAKIDVTLYKDGVATDQTLTMQADEDGQWQTAFNELPKYRAQGTLINYTVKEIDVDARYTAKVTHSETNPYDITLTNTYTPEVVTVAVEKTWHDEDNLAGFRPESIKVGLYADDNDTPMQVQTLQADEAGKWQAAFTQLPKYRNQGKTIKYTIKELNVDSHYEATTPSTTDEGVTLNEEGIYQLNLENTHEVAYIDVSGTKTWDDADNQDGLRPEKIVVYLLANGVRLQDEAGNDLSTEVTPDENGKWQYTFKDLPQYREAKEVIYTVEEAPVEGYESTVNGMDLTNYHEPELTTVDVKKHWNDANNQDRKRPKDITVTLLGAHGAVVETVQVTAKNNWQHTFKNLPKYAHGEEINYVVQEKNVPEYTATIDGFDITNSYTPNKTGVNVVKIWEDDNNRDKQRPDYITVKLLADGQATGQTIQLSAADHWQGAFTDLDEYQNGQKIVYTVEEDAVKGYKATIRGDATTGFVITNSYKLMNKMPNSHKGTHLPKTGTTNHWFLPIIGFGLIMSVGYFVRKRKEI